MAGHGLVLEYIGELIFSFNWTFQIKALLTDLNCKRKKSNEREKKINHGPWCFSPTVGPAYRCDNHTQFVCKTNYRCVPLWSVCNGQNDCRDNSDEQGCGESLLSKYNRCEIDLLRIGYTLVQDSRFRVFIVMC